jgi:hypothetical protein
VRSPHGADPDVLRAQRLARWLDDRYLDPLLGLLVPGAGDAASSLVGLYIVKVAFDKKLPAVVIARMLVHLAVDALVGIIPLAGDLFDFGFKANRRNAALLGVRHEERRARPGDWAFVAGAALLAAAALAIPFVLLVLAVRKFAAP